MCVQTDRQTDRHSWCWSERLLSLPMITHQGTGGKEVVQREGGRDSPSFQQSRGYRTLIFDSHSGSLRFTKTSSPRYPAFVVRGQHQHQQGSSLATIAKYQAVASNKSGTKVQDGYNSDGNSSASSPTCVIQNSRLRSVSSSPTLSSLSKVSSEMDKGDYSDVKELISNNSNCGTSPFDGDSAVFYAASNKDDSLQKGGDPRSFRKVATDTANRHGPKGGYNLPRSEKDPSSWTAIVHDVGHALHFSESTADIGFVTKNALALHNAQSKESQTAPFKSIQAAEEAKKKQHQQNGNGTIPAIPMGTTNRMTNQTSAANINNNNNNIFSFNSGRVAKSAAATEAPVEQYDYDSNFEKESAASFDFNRAAGAHRSVVGPLTKPTPSKWDDAEKWLSSGEAPAKTRPKNSPLSTSTATATTTQPSANSRKGDASHLQGTASATLNPCADASSSGENSMDGDEMMMMMMMMSPEEKCNQQQQQHVLRPKKVESNVKGLLRFAFLPAGKPVPLPPLPTTAVDRYPLEDVYENNGPSRNVNDQSDLKDQAPLYNTEPTVSVNMRTVCMVDMGTEMTPIASVEPSRTATPLRATTPTLGSPAISRPSSPGRGTNPLNPTPTSSGECNGSKPARISTDNSADHRSTKVPLSGKELQVKTRQEILALGTQLGKANIAAWATKEEEEADAAQALKASMELEEVRKNLLATRAAAWEEAEQSKYSARFKREEAKIQAWENHEKAKAEAEMRRIEVKVERMRSHANEKLMNKLAATRRHAEDRRAKAEALRGEQASKTASRADQIRRTGKIPTPLFGHLCG